MCNWGVGIPGLGALRSALPLSFGHGPLFLCILPFLLHLPQLLLPADEFLGGASKALIVRYYMMTHETR